MIHPEDIRSVTVTASDLDIRKVTTISRRTADTWQKGRSSRERLSDTAVGKIAETGFEAYLRDVGIPYRPWDDIRDNDYQKHAPLDGFLAHSSAADLLQSDPIAAAANTAQAEVYLPTEFLHNLENSGIYGYEVKSTRIASRHCPGGRLDYNRVLNDDFLQYPIVRTGLLTPAVRQRLMRSHSLSMAAARTPYFLVRAYVERANGGSTVHLIGYVARDEFFESKVLTVKSMPQPGKSERAIYYAVTLKHGRALSTLYDTMDAYTNPQTTTRA